MFCSECGARVPEGANNCPSCGALVVASTKKAPVDSSATAGGAGSAPVDPRQDDAQATSAGQASSAGYQQTSGAQYQQPAGAGYQQSAGTSYQQPAGSQYQQPAGAQYQQPSGSQYQQPSGAQYQQAAYVGYSNKDKVAAGLLAIFLGSLGIHKFYLGYNSEGLVMLLVSICGSIFSFLSFGITAAAPAVMGIIGLIEGIIYLSMSDVQFHDTYVVNKKTWF